MESLRTDLTFVFVHGAGGWGRYDAIDRYLPYWGMFTGDLMGFLRKKGFACYAASVDPRGSIWVRACELYAQIAGVRTDYGKAYSQREHTERFGRDYTGDPLIPTWDGNTKLVLLGHSMGGATVRLLAHLLAFGDPEEREATAPEELSPLFAGDEIAGMGGRVHSIVTLAAPSNGSTSLDMFTDSDFDVEKVKVPYWSRVTMKILSLRMSRRPAKKESPLPKDRVSNIDRTMEQNEKIATLPDVYYFSVACSSTKKQPDGTQRPSLRTTEILYFSRSIQIGEYRGVTPKGFVIDDAWRENDGLVNTVSAKAPIGAPQKDFDGGHIEKGIWQVFPVFEGDHMSVQGGFFLRRDVRWFYLDMLKMIAGLE